MEDLLCVDWLTLEYALDDSINAWEKLFKVALRSTVDPRLSTGTSHRLWLCHSVAGTYGSVAAAKDVCVRVLLAGAEGAAVRAAREVSMRVCGLSKKDIEERGWDVGCNNGTDDFDAFTWLRPTDNFYAYQT